MLTIYREETSVPAKDVLSAAFLRISVAMLVLACVGQTNIANAAVLYGYNFANQHLISFDSQNPGTLIADFNITGFNTNEYLIGMDIRPATGELYALATDGPLMRLLRINPASGAATAIGAPVATPTGNFYGMSFDPVADRIRLVGDSDINVRINPDDGTHTPPDTPLIYLTGDVGEGSNPNVVHIAHSNPYAGATATTLLGIDTSRDTLVRIGGINGSPSPNGGQLTTIGSLGVNATSYGAMAIAPGASFAYSALRVGGVSTLYTINLSSGSATPIGAIGSSTMIDGLAISPVNPCLDLDGDGTVQSLTDGLLLLRALLGVTGTSVTNNALPTPLPPRSDWASIKAYMNTNCGMSFGGGIAVPPISACLDLDGDGTVRPLTDGLMLVRALSGLTGGAVTNAALPKPLPPRSTWAAIRNHMNSNCGMHFGP